MKSKGFTLIEVLVALAILGIALTAIIKAAAQNVKDTVYLQNKIIANWTGNDVMSQARLGLLRLPTEPDTLSQETEMLGRKWFWKASIKPTPNPRIQEIHVNVMDESHANLVSLVSYRYVETNN